MKNFRAADKSHAGGDEKHDINFHWPYLGLTNSFDQVPRNIHTLPSIIVNFLLNSLNVPITFVVCATNQS
jgi:hypothetical protein